MDGVDLDLNQRFPYRSDINPSGICKEFDIDNQPIISKPEARIHSNWMDSWLYCELILLGQASGFTGDAAFSYMARNF